MPDFEILEEKEKEDPKLVEHLIHVTMLAESFLGGNIVLSDLARQTLKLLCLYHDFGGYLNEEIVRREEDIASRFRKASRLDRRLLDSRIICELLRLNGGEISPIDEAKPGLLDDSVNSAVQLLRRREFEDDDIRDIVIFLLQIQDNPSSLVHFKNTFKDMGFNRLENEIDSMFACLKIAEIFANGRWLWKRRTFYPLIKLEDQIPLQDFPFLMGFAIRALETAGIAPGVYVDRLNEVFRSPSPFLRVIKVLQEDRPLLVCDKLYLYLVSAREPSAAQIEDILNDGVAAAALQKDEVFQLAQIAELPTYLAEIEPHCAAITKESIEATARAIAEIYHNNWRFFNRNLSPDVIDRLRHRESQLVE